MTQLRQIPKIHHIPIREPMFINGIMLQAWITFFETLSKTANITDTADPIALAKQNQVLQGQIALHSGAVGLQTVLTIASGESLPTVAVGQMEVFCGLPMVAVNFSEF